MDSIGRTYIFSMHTGLICVCVCVCVRVLYGQENIKLDHSPKKHVVKLSDCVTCAPNFQQILPLLFR